MTIDHNRTVTPATDPDRWTDEETAFYNQGKCSWDVGVLYFGQTDNLCGKPSKPGASFGNCTEHEADLLENHYPDGSPR